MDFNFKGGFNAVLKSKWRLLSERDPTFGRRPNRHVLLKLVNDQIRQAIIKGQIDCGNLNDMMMVMWWTLSKTFLMCGGREHSDLTWSKFKFGQYEYDGELKGLPYVELLPLYDKTHSLHIGNHTERCKKVRNIHVCDPLDPLDPYVLLSKYKEMCAPDQERFYCYCLRKLKLERQVEKYGEINFFSNKKNAIGRNVIQKLCKTLAWCAGVEEWEKCTNHTFRMYGIT